MVNIIKIVDLVEFEDLRNKNNITIVKWQALYNTRAERVEFVVEHYYRPRQ